ncbi:hypothetical protein PSM7751_02956 [Pseudooceanicola marinus]|uniref:Uncharacterized protein n=1 Tax=Pseudooceanicola marinus TaxID=396013 RepID=A0A1X6ZU78_9RHOB|nr:hypothetical protein [Pseudooceanicola marinus]PJE30701.1 hypothetical protein CVM50_10735 [Pseudooceanicola marinus]SLN59751.1 hypothetical protein PSM7751_02956 [Pseudooceanicola marinus]
MRRRFRLGLLWALLSLLPAGQAGAEILAAPVTVTSSSLGPPLAVSIRPFRAEAQEIWHVAGACSAAEDPARVRLVAFAALADLTIYLTDAPEKAHRTICLTNPDAWPQARE